MPDEGNAHLADAAEPPRGFQVLTDPLLGDSLHGMLIRTATGRLFANEAFCGLFGYTREELQALDYLKIYHPDDRAIIAGRMQARMAGDLSDRRYEIRGLRQDGAVLWLECLARVVEWQGERATHLTLLDMTERKSAQAGRGDAERKFRPAFDVAPVPMLRIGRGGLLVDLNRAFEVLTGYARDELQDRPIAMFVPEEDEAGLVENIRSVWDHEIGIADCEHRFIRKDGSDVWVHSAISSVEGRDGAGRYLLSYVQDSSARREAELALKRSEESFRAVVDNSIQGIAILIPSSGFVFVNDAFCRIFGYERAELIGNPAALLHPDAREEIMMRVRARVRGNADAKRYEIRARKKDGGELWVEYLSSVTQWNGRRATLLAALDVTERKRAERHMETEERRFRELFMLAPIAMFRARGTQIVDVNPAFEALVGYPAAELVGRRLRDLMPPDEAEGLPRIRDMRKSGAERLELHHRLIRKDGSVIWTESAYSYVDDHAPELRTVIGHVIDVTERHAAEQAVAERERLYRNLVEGSLQGVLISGNGKPVFVNDAFARMYGYAPEEILAFESTRALYAPDERAKLDGFVAARLEGDTSVRRYEIKGLKKDGTVFWTEQLTSPLDWNGQSAIQVLSIEIAPR